MSVSPSKAYMPPAPAPATHRIAVIQAPLYTSDFVNIYFDVIVDIVNIQSKAGEFIRVAYTYFTSSD